MFSAARNIVFDYFRRENVALKYADEQKNSFSAEAAPYVPYDNEVLTQAVARCVDTMPPQRMMFWKLSREAYLSNQEIADKLHLSKRTVDAHLAKALADIRTVLSKIN